MSEKSDTSFTLPAGHCLVPTNAFNELREDVREIKTAVIGNESLGHRGLINRMNIHEGEITALKMQASDARTSLKVLLAIAVGLASVISTVASLWVQAIAK